MKKMQNLLNYVHLPEPERQVTFVRASSMTVYHLGTTVEMA